MTTPVEEPLPTPTTWERVRAYVPIKLIAVVLVVFLIVQGYQWLSQSGDTTITARFANADGLYKGDDVKVLGVAVGTVTGIHPEGNDVKVTLRVNGGQKIPAGASAAIVSPSLVSGRYVQLAPAYTSGPTIDDGATIPVDRTAVPLSFDEVKAQLIELTSTLAPQGSKSQPLRDTINGLQASLRQGNADALRTAIQGLQTTATTLSDGRNDLFGTISNLNSFTQNLAVNDAAVAGFTKELSSVSGVLAANRRELTNAVTSLTAALGSTGDFLKTNRTRINTSIRDLNLLSAALADRSNELAAVLHIAPTALTDLSNIIENQAITASASLTGLTDPAQLICGAILGSGGTAAQCKSALGGLLSLKPTATKTAAAKGGAGGFGSLLTGSGSISSVTSLLTGLLGSTLGGHR